MSKISHGIDIFIPQFFIYLKCTFNWNSIFVFAQHSILPNLAFLLILFCLKNVSKCVYRGNRHSADLIRRLCFSCAGPRCSPTCVLAFPPPHSSSGKPVLETILHFSPLLVNCLLVILHSAFETFLRRDPIFFITKSAPLKSLFISSSKWFL